MLTFKCNNTTLTIEDDDTMRIVRLINGRAYQYKLKLEPNMTLAGFKQLVNIYCVALDDNSFKRLCSDINLKYPL